MSESYGGESMQDYDEEINWDDVGNPPDVGKYNLEVEKAEYSQTKTKKHAGKVQFKIVGYDPEKPELEKNMGRTVFENFNFFQNAAFTVKGFATAAGIELPPSINRAVLEEWLAGIVGTVVGGELKHREFNDQKQASVAKWFAPMEVDQQAAADAEAAAEEEEEGDDHAEEEEEEEEEPEPPKRSLREAAATSAKPKTNGHAVNGKANGAPHRAPPVAAKPAKKSSKPQARR